MCANHFTYVGSFCALPTLALFIVGSAHVFHSCVFTHTSEIILTQRLSSLLRRLQVPARLDSQCLQIGRPWPVSTRAACRPVRATKIVFTVPTSNWSMNGVFPKLQVVSFAFTLFYFFAEALRPTDRHCSFGFVSFR